MLISRYNLHTHLSLCHLFLVSYYESINTDVSGMGRDGVGWELGWSQGKIAQGKAQGKAYKAHLTQANQAPILRPPAQ